VKRRLLNILTALSLLLFVASVTMWVRSYCRSDTLFLTRRSEGETFTDVTFWTLDTARGSFAVRRDSNHIPRMRTLGMLNVRPWKWEAHGATDRSYLASPTGRGPGRLFWRAGFELHRARFDGADGGRSVQWRLTWPAWATVLLTAAMPAVRMWRRLRRGRFGPGHCRGCGYDLRGNESGVCPECGQRSEAQSPPCHAAAERGEPCEP
jgi:hypothetical protein